MSKFKVGEIVEARCEVKGGDFTYKKGKIVEVVCDSEEFCSFYKLYNYPDNGQWFLSCDGLMMKLRKKIMVFK